MCITWKETLNPGQSASYKCQGSNIQIYCKREYAGKVSYKQVSVV